MVKSHETTFFRGKTHQPVMLAIEWPSFAQGPSQEKPRSPEDPGDHRDLEPARAGWGDKMTEEKGGCNTFHDQNMEVSLGSSLDFSHVRDL